MVDTEQLAAWHAQHNEWGKLEALAKTHTCACGGALVVALKDSKPALRCGNCGFDTNGLQKGRSWTQRYKDGEAIPIEIANRIEDKRRKEMEKQYGKETATALMKVAPAGQLTQADAMHILKLVYPRVPEQEIIRCAILCRDFGLHPLNKEIYIMPFKNKKTGEVEWVTVMGIAASRKIAVERKGEYSYLENSPRAATKAEIVEQFGDDSDEEEANIISVCRVKSQAGNEAIGFGLWPRGDLPYGIDKGNSKRNMANTRAERQAISRLPGKPLPQVEVIDETYARLTEGDVETGEITAPLIETAPASQDMPKMPQPEEKTGEEAGQAPEAPKMPKLKRDPATIKDWNGLVQACFHDFGIQPEDVRAELHIRSKVDLTMTPAQAYIQIAAVRESAGNRKD